MYNKQAKRVCRKFNLITQTWEHTNFKSLVPNDVFQLYESDGRVVCDSYNATNWIAKSYPYIDEKTKVWTIYCDTYAVKK